MLFRHSRDTHTCAPCNAARRGHTLKFLRVIYLCIAENATELVSIIPALLQAGPGASDM